MPRDDDNDSFSYEPSDAPRRRRRPEYEDDDDDDDRDLDLRRSRHHIENYLVWSIVSTLLCCLPFGVVAIVYSAQVDGLVAQGRDREAQAAADNAKMWCWLSFGFGLIPIAIVGLQMIIAIGAGMR